MNRYIHNKVPKIRFTGYEGEWETKQLADICDTIIAGGDVDKKKLAPTGNYPVLANALTNDGLVGFYDKDYRVEAPAVTVTGRGDIGYAIARKINFTPVVRLIALKTNHDVDFLANAINRLDIIIESTGVPQLTVPQLKTYRLSLSKDPEEEKKIGVFLSSLNKLIELYQEKIELLKTQKQTLLQLMFPKPGEHVPQIRFEGFSEPWEERKLSNVANYRNGKAHEKAISDFGQYIVVNSKFISSEGEVKKYSEEQIEPLYQNETVFVLSDVPNGKAIAKTFLIVQDNTYTLNQRVAALTPKAGIDPYFLYTKLNRHPYFLRFDDGLKQTNLSLKDVQGFSSMFPKHEEQAKIGAFFSALDNNITLHQEKLEQLKALKKTLLKNMFV